MKLGCMAGVEYKGKIVFSSTYMNGLFELDINTKRVRFLKTIEGEAWEAHLFRKAFLFGEEVWFIPQRGKRVICVDLNTYDIEYFDLQYNRKFEETESYPYYFAYIDGLIINERYLYCIPNGLDELLVIDMREHCVSSVNISNNPEQDLIYGAFFYQERVHLLSQKGLLDKAILIERNDIEEKNWKFDTTGFLSYVQYEMDLYLIPAYSDGKESRKLAKIDLTSGDVVYLNMPDSPEEYYGGLFMNDSLILLPDCGTDFIKMNIEEKTFEKVPYPNMLKDKIKNGNNAARVITSKERSLISFIHGGYILELDGEGNISNYFDVRKVEITEVEKVIIEYKSKDIVFPQIVMEEEQDLSLKEFIQFI